MSKCHIPKDYYIFNFQYESCKIMNNVNIFLYVCICVNNSYSFLLEDGLHGIVSCTACGQQVNHFQKDSIYRHPSLQVLICKVCNDLLIIHSTNNWMHIMCQTWCTVLELWFTVLKKRANIVVGKTAQLVPWYGRYWEHTGSLCNLELGRGGFIMKTI